MRWPRQSRQPQEAVPTVLITDPDGCWREARSAGLQAGCHRSGRRPEDGCWPLVHTNKRIYKCTPSPPSDYRRNSILVSCCLFYPFIFSFHFGQRVPVPTVWYRYRACLAKYIPVPVLRNSKFELLIYLRYIAFVTLRAM